jgi:hypothetical protein
MIAGKFIQRSFPIGCCQSQIRRYYVINLDDLEEDFDPNIDDFDGCDWAELSGKGWSRTYEIQECRPSNRGAFITGIY